MPVSVGSAARHSWRCARLWCTGRDAQSPHPSRSLERESVMKRITVLLVAVATLVGVVAFTAILSRHSTAREAAPIFVTKIPPGYRDWKVISVAHEEGDLNDIRAILGNDVA